LQNNNLFCRMKVLCARTDVRSGRDEALKSASLQYCDY